MRTVKSMEVLTLALLAATAIVSFLLPARISIPIVAASGASDTISLYGVVRDFEASHVDFAVVPAEGPGHCASSVIVALGADGRPVFNAGSDGNGPLDSRIVHWKLDDGGGSTAIDEMGSNPGTLVSGPTWTTGADGGALHFDGIDDHVEVPSSPETQITGDITFSGWFKLDENFDASSPDTMVIMEKFLDTEHDFHIGFTGLDYNRAEVPKGTMVFKIENGPTSDYYRYVWTNRTSWTAGVWYHFAAVLVSSDTAQNKLIIDAVDDTSAANAGGVGFIDTDYNAPLRIGGKTIDYSGVATDIFFKGTIDDVMIFDRALAAADFTQLPEPFKVGSQWQDDAGNNIAPHLAAVGGGNVLRLVSAPSISGTAIFDSWDSSVGPYGGANVGPPPTIEMGASMPVITLPDGMPPNSGTVVFDSSSPTIGADVTCDRFTVKDTVTVVGDVRVLCYGDVSFGAGAVLELAPGATLTVWAGAKLDVQPAAQLNVNTGDPERLTFYALGDKGISLGNPGAVIYATVVAPHGVMSCQPHSEFYGVFTGLGLDVANDADFHLDATENLDACSVAIRDSMGAHGVESTGGITTADTFGEWFRDVIGTNLSAVHAITLQDDGAGVWSYLDDAFHPIEGRLYGNGGDAHNENFTYHVAAEFQYTACSGQFIEFEGGDGAWLFVDGALALDLGGVDSDVPQFVALDRLGLTDGQDYRMDLFYAEREGTSSVFRLRTSLELSSGSFPPTVSAMFD